MQHAASNLVSEQTREITVDLANWQLLCGVWQLQPPKQVSSTVRCALALRDNLLAWIAGGSVAQKCTCWQSDPTSPAGPCAMLEQQHMFAVCTRARLQQVLSVSP